jgi:hypothetical protein
MKESPLELFLVGFHDYYCTVVSRQGSKLARDLARYEAVLLWLSLSLVTANTSLNWMGIVGMVMTVGGWRRWMARLKRKGFVGRKLVGLFHVLICTYVVRQNGYFRRFPSHDMSGSSRTVTSDARKKKCCRRAAVCLLRCWSTVVVC